MNNSDADHFIASFTPAKELPVASSKTWKQFNLEEKGCSLLFPGDARKNPKMAQGIIDSWNYSTYDLADPGTGSYYILQIRDIDQGLHLTADSNIFIGFRERLANSIKTVTLDVESTFNGFPVLKYEGIEQNDVVFKSVIVNRGNRCYYVIVEGQNTPSAVADMNNFLHSFNLLDYNYKDWGKQVQTAGNFQSLAPAPFIQKIDTDSTVAEKDKPIHFVSYDALDCSSYEIIKYKVSPYYYATSDSALFQDIASGYRKSTDSVLSEKWVTNGNLKGQEWIVQSPGNNNVKKARIFLSGDTVYYILCYLPSQKINEVPYQRFFTEFRVIKEDLNYGVYKRKIERILADLQSKDSVIFSEASEALGKAKFIPSDKSLLEEAFLKEYPDDTSGSRNTADMIFDELIKLVDNGTVDFIKSRYAGLTGNREFKKMNLLNLLANYKTQYSYNLLKDLLTNQPPKDDGNYILSYRITDSIELARSLFPEILQLSNNPILVQRVMGITAEMLEKKQIPVSMLDQYRGNFLHTADTLYNRYSKMDYISQSYLVTDMLSLLQQLNEAESNRILQKYLGLEDLDIKQSTIQNLLKNGISVDSKQIEKVASNKAYRQDFYVQLHKIGKTAVFPAAYKTQQSIGEADIYQYGMNEDYEPDEIKSLGTKTIKYKGSNYKLHLFRVIYEGKDQDSKPFKETYLGISGPFSMDPKDLITESELTFIFFDEEYDSKKTEKLIQDHIKSVETGETEEE